MFIKRIYSLIFTVLAVITIARCYEDDGDEFTISRVIRQVVFPGKNEILQSYII